MQHIIKVQRFGKKVHQGGIFTLLAEWVISRGGVVYAVRFDDNYKIIHDSFEEMSAIESFRGSKYAQSDLNDTFRKIKESLNSPGLTIPLFIKALDIPLNS